ncbi:MAG TPA: hypothetical protein VHI72_15425 [Hyphomicrobiaceae bacterium]|jgi:ElaB/YqjD/DUF883 family membrane-anchored ribosome-binding protein|nr:hypothetical protein [Hyphomicrobiaceae bacterium]
MAQSTQRGGAEDLVGQATDQLKKAGSSAAGQIRESGAGEVAGNFKEAVDRSAKDQPMATLAMAAALGFVLGAIWKS